MPWASSSPLRRAGPPSLSLGSFLHLVTLYPALVGICGHCPLNLGAPTVPQLEKTSCHQVAAWLSYTAAGTLLLTAA